MSHELLHALGVIATLTPAAAVRALTGPRVEPIEDARLTALINAVFAEAYPHGGMLALMRHRFCHELCVRYADTDMQGHVFFANYFTFCDEAMTAYLHAIDCPPAQLATLGVDFVYADARCSYTGSAKWEDRLYIHVRPSELGRSSVRWQLAIYRDAEAAEPIARAELATVIVGIEDLRPTPIPAPLREAIVAYEPPEARVEPS